MPRLIDTDALKEDILALPNCPNGFSDTYDKACIIGVIDEQPTIEERKTVSDEEWTKAWGGWTNQPECKKGKWISHYDEDAKEGWYECSYCHSERAFNTNYCPDCGADMRG